MPDSLFLYPFSTTAVMTPASTCSTSRPVCRRHARPEALQNLDRAAANIYQSQGVVLIFQFLDQTLLNRIHVDPSRQVDLQRVHIAVVYLKDLGLLGQSAEDVSGEILGVLERPPSWSFPDYKTCRFEIGGHSRS